MGDISEEQLEHPFSLSCDLPCEMTAELGTLEGQVSCPRFQAFEELEKETETRISVEPVEGDDERRQCLTIEGPLLCTFIAHRFIMKRYHGISSSPKALPVEAPSEPESLQGMVKPSSKCKPAQKKFAPAPKQASFAAAPSPAAEGSDAQVKS